MLPAARVGKGEPTTHPDTALCALNPLLPASMGGGSWAQAPRGVLETLGGVPFISQLCPSAMPERRTVAAVGTGAVSRGLALAHLRPTSQEPVELHLLPDKGVFREAAESQGI